MDIAIDPETETARAAFLDNLAKKYGDWFSGHPEAQCVTSSTSDLVVVQIVGPAATAEGTGSSYEDALAEALQSAFNVEWHRERLTALPAQRRRA